MPTARQHCLVLPACRAALLAAGLWAPAAAVGREGRSARGVAEAFEFTPDSNLVERPSHGGPLLRRESTSRPDGVSPVKALLPRDPAYAWHLRAAPDGPAPSPAGKPAAGAHGGLQILEQDQGMTNEPRKNTSNPDEEPTALAVEANGEIERQGAAAKQGPGEVEQLAEQQTMPPAAGASGTDTPAASPSATEEAEASESDAAAEAEGEAGAVESARPGEQVQAASKELFDCNEASNEWKFGWSIAKREWCCRYKRKGCQPVSSSDSERQGHGPNGEEVCEGQGWSMRSCLSLGCCYFDDTTSICFSAVGEKPCSIVQKAPIPVQQRLQQPLTEGSASGDEGSLAEALHSKDREQGEKRGRAAEAAPLPVSAPLPSPISEKAAGETEGQTS